MTPPPVRDSQKIHQILRGTLYPVQASFNVISRYKPVPNLVGVSVVVPADLVALLALADDLAAILALAFVAIYFPTVTRLFDTLN